MKKIILSEELDLELIIKEYQLCHKLKHNNIVEILGIFKRQLDITTYVIYILMEVGMSDWEKEIKSHSDKSKPYTEQELIHILTQLVSCLSFLQHQGVSHRDIKPQNVLTFKGGVYKIADFGEAKQIEKISQHRQINTLRGTELYMSPLLYNGLRCNQLDIKHNLFKSDVYSLGLCMLFAATLSVNSIYEIRKMVDMKNIRMFLERLLMKKYSEGFIKLLGDLLELNEMNRPDFVELEKVLHQLYQHEEGK
jgi:serine/threonine protein kinase